VLTLCSRPTESCKPWKRKRPFIYFSNPAILSSASTPVAPQILGHPRGRVYNFRLGLTADWPRVFAEAAKLDKAVKSGSYPNRQDLSPDFVQMAAKAGCRISLGTDSHGAFQLRFMGLSAASALLGDVKRDRIVNFLAKLSLTVDFVPATICSPRKTRSSSR